MLVAEAVVHTCNLLKTSSFHILARGGCWEAYGFWCIVEVWYLKSLPSLCPNQEAKPFAACSIFSAIC